jgi:hypothetical protein
MQMVDTQKSAIECLKFSILKAKRLQAPLPTFDPLQIE